MSTPAKRRLMKDLSILSSSTEKLYAQPCEDDLMTWVSIIIGPEGTPFENGTFSMVLKFDETYPFNPPYVRFISDMFHPNIYKNGDLCLDILNNKWSPTYDVLSVLLSIQSLLADANIDSPANLEAAKMLKSDPAEYIKRINETVKGSWKDIKLLESMEHK